MKKIIVLMLVIVTNNLLYSQEGYINYEEGGCKVFLPDLQNKKIIWVGKCLNGYASGFGLFEMYRDDTLSATYLGFFTEGKLEGYGNYQSAKGDGGRYEGQFAKTSRNGEGTYYYHDGKKYSGYWKNSKKDGIGTLYAKDGSIINSGYWSAGKYIGQENLNPQTQPSSNNNKVLYTNENCQINLISTSYKNLRFEWNGDCKNGMANGVGTLKVYQSDNNFYCIYKGNMKNGMRHGKGECFEIWNSSKVSRNVTIYDGDWIEDSRSGNGSKTEFSREGWEIKLFGEFENNQANGEGTYNTSRKVEKYSKKYVGTMKADRPNGYGTWYNGDGSLYEQGTGCWDYQKYLGKTCESSNNQYNYSSTSSSSSSAYSIISGNENIKKVELASDAVASIDIYDCWGGGCLCNENYSVKIFDSRGELLEKYDDYNSDSYIIYNSNSDAFPLTVEISYYTDSDCRNGNYRAASIKIYHKSKTYKIWLKT